ncbi:MAG TPA: hypothetical protein VMU54_05220 [Planctomycetota bacterium]|nr:hypothetical protein [Planctomycetota bacterium]
MMPTGSRTRRYAVLAGQLLALLLLLVSPRALFAPTENVSKAQDSKRPKTPKNIVRAEPIRVPADEKQGQTPSLTREDTVAGYLDAGLGRSARIPSLPRAAFTQLSKPEYLKSDSPGTPHIPLSPPA